MILVRGDTECGQHEHLHPNTRLCKKIMMVIRFRSMEDLGPKQEKTAGWELVRLLRFDVNQDEQVGDDDHVDNCGNDDDGKDNGDNNGDRHELFSGRLKSLASLRRMFRLWNHFNLYSLSFLSSKTLTTILTKNFNQVAVNHCGEVNPIAWLTENWGNMIETVSSPFLDDMMTWNPFWIEEKVINPNLLTTGDDSGQQCGSRGRRKHNRWGSTLSSTTTNSPTFSSKSSWSTTQGRSVRRRPGRRWGSTRATSGPPSQSALRAGSRRWWSWRCCWWWSCCWWGWWWLGLGHGVRWGQAEDCGGHIDHDDVIVVLVVMQWVWWGQAAKGGDLDDDVGGDDHVDEVSGDNNWIHEQRGHADGASCFLYFETILDYDKFTIIIIITII